MLGEFLAKMDVAVPSISPDEYGLSDRHSPNDGAEESWMATRVRRASELGMPGRHDAQVEGIHHERAFRGQDGPPRILDEEGAGAAARLRDDFLDRGSLRWR